MLVTNGQHFDASHISATHISAPKSLAVVENKKNIFFGSERNILLELR
jgi:hypothetical protein